MASHWVVSGGAGYVGAHVTAALGAAGLPVVVLDDLSTGRRGRVPAGVALVVGAVGDRGALDEVLARACGVVHTAGPPSWPTSADADLDRAHVADLAMLLAGLVRHGIRQFVATSPVPRSTGEMGERLLTTVGSAADIATISLRCGAAVGAASHELAPDWSRGLVGRAVESAGAARRSSWPARADRRPTGPRSPTTRTSRTSPTLTSPRWLGCRRGGMGPPPTTSAPAGGRRCSGCSTPSGSSPGGRCRGSRDPPVLGSRRGPSPTLSPRPGTCVGGPPAPSSRRCGLSGCKVGTAWGRGPERMGRRAGHGEHGHTIPVSATTAATCSGPSKASTWSSALCTRSRAPDPPVPPRTRAASTSRGLRTAVPVRSEDDQAASDRYASAGGVHCQGWNANRGARVAAQGQRPVAGTAVDPRAWHQARYQRPSPRPGRSPGRRRGVEAPGDASRGR